MLSIIIVWSYTGFVRIVKIDYFLGKLMRMKIRFIIIWISAVLAAAGMVALAGPTVPPSVAAEMVEIKISIKDHVFVPSEIRTRANTKIKLIVTNEDASVEEFESHSLNREKIIRPGRTATIMLPPLKPGTYEFFGEFHPETARGKIIVE